MFRYGKFPKKTEILPKYEHLQQKTKVIALDELDYLYTKDQSVLYNIFDWPHFKKVAPL
jgi:Cdc6-like AAA superfamily ATPase